MPRRGRDLERLVKLIEASLANHPNVEVTSPGKLRDKVTGSTRDVDVLVRIKQRHRVLNVAIECRDRSRPVDVNQVEALITKKNHVKADRNVIVSSKGFEGPALVKARFENIDCMTLSQAEQFEWAQVSAFHVYIREIFDTKVLLPPSTPLPANPTLWFRDGRRLDNGVIADIVNRALIERNRLSREAGEEVSAPELGREYAFRGTDNAADLILRTPDGDVPINELSIATKWRWVVRERPLEFYEYLDNETNIRQMAIRVKVPEMGGGEMAIVRAEDGSMTITMQGPDKAKKKPSPKKRSRTKRSRKPRKPK